MGQHPPPLTTGIARRSGGTDLVSNSAGYVRERVRASKTSWNEVFIRHQHVDQYPQVRVYHARNLREPTQHYTACLTVLSSSNTSGSFAVRTPATA